MDVNASAYHVAMRFWKDLAKTVPAQNGDPVAVFEGFGGEMSQPAEDVRPVCIVFNEVHTPEQMEAVTRYIEGKGPRPSFWNKATYFKS